MEVVAMREAPASDIGGIIWRDGRQEGAPGFSNADADRTETELAGEIDGRLKNKWVKPPDRWC